MSFLNYVCRNRHLFKTCRDLFHERILFSTAIAPTTDPNKPSKDDDSKDENNEKSFSQLAQHRFVYPEFLPHPNYEYRHKLREKLERMDMLKRRSVIDLPEFYVGSILSVTTADPFASGKENRFVGICIARTYIGLRATFTLRNIVDGQGVEIMYDLYNPTIQKIDVLRLEKRLDNELYFLRDCDPKYSTFPFDMEPEFRVEGEPVKVNPLVIKLKPPPWSAKWERAELKGVEKIDLDILPRIRKRKFLKTRTPWESYDLMKEYRRTIPEDDQQEIWEDVEAHRQQFQLKKKKWKQRVLLKAKKKTE